jgi:hypothetical protein
MKITKKLIKEKKKFQGNLIFSCEIYTKLMFFDITHEKVEKVNRGKRREEIVVAFHLVLHMFFLARISQFS